MTFDWSEYFNLARELAGQATSPANQEAKLRSSVSRAYYAAFCKARNYLRDVDKLSVPIDGSAHQYVQEKFEISSDPLRKQLGEDLKRLRRRRNMADYWDSVRNPESETKMSLAWGEQILTAITSLP